MLAGLLASASLACLAAPALSQYPTELGPEETFYVYCSWSSSPTERTVTQIEPIAWRDTIQIYDGKRLPILGRGSYIGDLERHLNSKGIRANCEGFNSPKYGSPDELGHRSMGWHGDVRVSILNVGRKVSPTMFVLDKYRENARVVSLDGKTRSSAAETQKERVTDPAPKVTEQQTSGPTPAEIAAEKRRAVAERNRQAQAKYEAELAAQKAKVEEFERAKAEVERRKQEQRAAADRVLAEHNAKLAAHAETVRQHEEALARHKAEVDGAKAKILADFDKGQAEASTDTDANRCVSGAEMRYNSGFKGNTAATVSNGCDTKADIQICLKVDARWNCGLRLGVLPRNSYTHAAPGGTGEVQVDARVTGSSRPLVTPN